MMTYADALNAIREGKTAARATWADKRLFWIGDGEWEFRNYSMPIASAARSGFPAIYDSFMASDYGRQNRTNVRPFLPTEADLAATDWSVVPAP